MINDWEWEASIKPSLNEDEQQRTIYHIRTFYGSMEWIRYKQFGITPQDVDAMFQSQNKVCAICGQSEEPKKNGTVRPLSLDHNHETGKVRALLCHRCNCSLGLLREDPKIIKSMLRYLEKHGEVSA